MYCIMAANGYKWWATQQRHSFLHSAAFWENFCSSHSRLSFWNIPPLLPSLTRPGRLESEGRFSEKRYSYCTKS